MGETDTAVVGLGDDDKGSHTRGGLGLVLGRTRGRAECGKDRRGRAPAASKRCKTAPGAKVPNPQKAQKKRGSFKGPRLVVERLQDDGALVGRKLHGGHAVHRGVGDVLDLRGGVGGGGGSGAMCVRQGSAST